MYTPTCCIQWIDRDGKPTPDRNESTYIACAHELVRVIDPHAYPHMLVEYGPKIVQTSPMCSTHYLRVEGRMLYGNGGMWEFKPMTRAYAEGYDTGCRHAMMNRTPEERPADCTASKRDWFDGYDAAYRKPSITTSRRSPRLVSR